MDLGWYYDLFDTMHRNLQITPISEISPAILEKFIMSFYVHISRVDSAGFVMRYLTIEYSVLHLLRYSSK